MLPNGDLVTSKHRLRQADLGDARQYASKKRNRRLTDNVLSLDTLVAFKQRAPTGRLGGVQTGKVLPTGELTASNPDRGPPENELVASIPNEGLPMDDMSADKNCAFKRRLGGFQRVSTIRLGDIQIKSLHNMTWSLTNNVLSQYALVASTY